MARVTGGSAPPEVLESTECRCSYERRVVLFEILATAMQFGSSAPTFGGHGVAVKYKLTLPSGCKKGAGFPASALVHAPVKLIGMFALAYARVHGPFGEEDAATYAALPGLTLDSDSWCC